MAAGWRWARNPPDAKSMPKLLTCPPQYGAES